MAVRLNTDPMLIADLLEGLRKGRIVPFCGIVRIDPGEPCARWPGLQSAHGAGMQVRMSAGFADLRSHRSGGKSPQDPAVFQINSLCQLNAFGKRVDDIALRFAERFDGDCNAVCGGYGTDGFCHRNDLLPALLAVKAIGQALGPRLSRKPLPLRPERRRGE